MQRLHRDRYKLYVYGNDYPTLDGTGLRDYIHVQDLGLGYIASLEYISPQKSLITLSLGTGKPYSVMDMVKAFSNISGKNIHYEFVNSRAGHLAEYNADPLLAKELIKLNGVLDLVLILCVKTRGVCRSIRNGRIRVNAKAK